MAIQRGYNILNSSRHRRPRRGDLPVPVPPAASRPAVPPVPGLRAGHAAPASTRRWRYPAQGADVVSQLRDEARQPVVRRHRTARAVPHPRRRPVPDRVRGQQPRPHEPDHRAQHPRQPAHRACCCATRPSPSGSPAATKPPTRRGPAWSSPPTSCSAPCSRPRRRTPARRPASESRDQRRDLGPARPPRPHQRPPRLTKAVDHDRPATSMRLTSFTITPGAQWNVNCQVAAFPLHWLEAAHRRLPPPPGNRQGLVAADPKPDRAADRSRPSRHPRQLQAQRRPLHRRTARRGHRGASRRRSGLGHHGGAPPGDRDVDWWELCQPEDLTFRSETVNLLEYGTWPNGTAAPAAAMFNLLPTFLAQRVADARMPLLGRSRDWILGPPQSDGRRSAVLWPPEKLEDNRKPETHSSPRRSPSTSRPCQPIRYPASTPTSASAASRSCRSPTFPPAATARPAQPSGSTPRKDSCARPSRTRCWPPRSPRPGPREAGQAPVAVVPGPGDRPGQAHPPAVPQPGKGVHRPGHRGRRRQDPRLRPLQRGNQEPGRRHRRPRGISTAEQAGKARALLHAANTGFVPADHMEAHEQLVGALGPLGLRMHDPCPRAGKRSQRRARPAEVPGQEYTLELWTQSDLTREAVLAALEHHHHLTPQPDPADPACHRLHRRHHAAVILKDAGHLGAGIDRPEGDDTPAIHADRRSTRKQGRRAPRRQPGAPCGHPRTRR